VHLPDSGAHALLSLLIWELHLLYGYFAELSAEQIIDEHIALRRLLKLNQRVSEQRYVIISR
jgi:hypothetical protein